MSRWLWAILRVQRRPIGIGRAGDTGHDRGRLGRPATTGCQRGGQGESGPRVAGVPDRLGHVPVAFTPGQPKRCVGRGIDERRERVGERRQLLRDPRGRTHARSPSNFTPDADEGTRIDATPRRHDVGRARLEGVHPGRGHGDQSRSKRSTGSTKTVAPPTSTSSG